MKLSPTLLMAAAAIFSLAASAGDLAKADKLIGTVVTDSHNQHAGKLSELAIDLSTGRVAEVLIDTGGYLTSKQRIVAVPPEVFVYKDATGELRMNADLDAFDNAPEFNGSTWKESTAASSVRDVYKRFHVQPYGEVGPLELSGRLAGMVAKNQNNQRVGKIDSIVVDLENGTVPGVILAANYFGGHGALTAVPPQAFFYQPEFKSLLLDATRDSVKKAPHFKSDNWRSGVSDSLSMSAVNNSYQTLHSLNAPPPTEAQSQSDAAITMEIERRITVAEGLSMDARHVQIKTVRSWVTLMGAADSEKEKQQLGSIAAAVVTADHVINKVEVRVFAVARDNYND